MKNFDLKKVEILDWMGIDHRDHPDYCNAYIADALYDGQEMTDEDLETLNENYRDWVYERLWDYLH